MNNDQHDGEATGFEGIASMTPSVDAAIRDADLAASNATKNGANPTSPPGGATNSSAGGSSRKATTAGNRTGSTSPSPPLAGAKQKKRISSTEIWFILIFGGGLLIAFMAATNSGDSSPPSSIQPQQPVAEQAQLPAGVQAGPPSVNPPAVVFSEEKPPVGQGLILSVNQIIYCQSQSARMAGAQAQLLSYSDESLIERFNALVDDFNPRCGYYQYHQRDFDQAMSVVNPIRTSLVSEGALAFSPAPAPLPSTDTLPAYPPVMTAYPQPPSIPPQFQPVQPQYQPQPPAYQTPQQPLSGMPNYYQSPPQAYRPAAPLNSTPPAQEKSAAPILENYQTVQEEYQARTRQQIVEPAPALPAQPVPAQNYQTDSGSMIIWGAQESGQGEPMDNQ